MNSPTTTSGAQPYASANPETEHPAPSADEIRKAIETLVALALPLNVICANRDELLVGRKKK